MREADAEFWRRYGIEAGFVPLAPEWLLRRELEIADVLLVRAGPILYDIRSGRLHVAASSTIGRCRHRVSLERETQPPR